MSAERPKLVIWGASGHALVVADIVRQIGKYEILGFIDDTCPERMGRPFCGSVVLGGRERLALAAQQGARFAIVAIGDCEARLRLAEVVHAHGLRLASAVHPSAVLAPDVQVGAGVVVAAGAVVCPAVTLGENVIVNTSASVDHESQVEDGAHIGPGVRLAGRVNVGRSAFIGAGAVVTPGVHIGARAQIGAGALVLSDVPADVVAYGAPARVIRPRARLNGG
jgi:UDP-N-acetylbacillosamine N-acetyltransferase